MHILLIIAALNIAPPVTVERYTFESKPWVNLHQRLLHQAQWGKPDTPERLTAEEKKVWEEVVGSYQTLFQKRSPIFNQELMDIDAALAANREAALPDAIPPKAAEALRKAMPLYERAQWPEDDAINRFWMTVAEPLLKAAGPELLAALGKAYGTPMPKRIQVDVSAYGGRVGAYTTGDADSVRVVMSSLDETYQGFSALEMLMHEPSHGVVGAVDYAIGSDITRLSKELNRKPNPNLWHALLFYTSGVLTRDALARRGVTDYKPVVYRGLFDQSFRGLQQAIETHWGAFLAGTKTREDAIRAILQETSAE
jgi:hypothetical protein